MRSISWVLLVLALLATPVPAAAQLDAAAAEQAQQLVDQGMERFRAEDYRAALERFLRAHDLSGDVRMFYPIGRCHEELGELVEAIAAFEQFVVGDVAADERGRAEATLRRLRERVATGRVVVQVAPFGAAVLVDGRSVGTAPIAPLALAPGRHEIAARAPGHVAAVRTIDVVGGREATVVLELAAETVAPPGTDEPPPSPPVEPRASGYSPWSWVTLGGGLALAAGGTVAYVLGELDHRNVADTAGYGTGAILDMTYKRAHTLEEDGDRKKIAGYALWGVGGAAVVAGTVLLVLDAKRAPSGDVTVGWSPAPKGGVLTLGGSF